MKILAIDGSPRNGNTQFILGCILSNAKGAETELIKLKSHSIDFCGGGDSCCPVNLKCHIRDDMPNIYAKLEAADIIVLGSPCYFSNVTAIMKNFMDRCNPYFFNKKLAGKKFFLVSVGGYEKSIKEAIKCMENFLNGIKGKVIGSFYTVADKLGETAKNDKVIKELQNISEQLIKNA